MKVSCIFDCVHVHMFIVSVPSALSVHLFLVAHLDLTHVPFFFIWVGHFLSFMPFFLLQRTTCSYRGPLVATDKPTITLDLPGLLSQLPRQWRQPGGFGGSFLPFFLLVFNSEASEESALDEAAALVSSMMLTHSRDRHCVIVSGSSAYIYILQP